MYICKCIHCVRKDPIIRIRPYLVLARDELGTSHYLQGGGGGGLQSVKGRGELIFTFTKQKGGGVLLATLKGGYNKFYTGF